MKGNHSVKNRRHKAALIVGICLGCFHLLWALLVVIFSEKAVLPVALWIPFAPPIDFAIPFDVTTAPMLFAASFAFGYLTAWLGIFLWDRVAEKSD